MDQYGRATYDGRPGRPFLVPRAPCGRLTLTSATPFLSSTVTAATTIYYTPYDGNFVELYDTTVKQWIPRTFSELSIAVPSTLFRLFDLYLYWTGSACALEVVNWNQTTGSITAATAAAPSVITSAAHGLSNGNLVGLAGLNNTVGTDATQGLNDAVWNVANVAANTFEPKGSICNGLVASTTGSWYKIPNTRATSLATQDGRYTKTGDASRLYLGTGMTTGTSGQTECHFGGADTPASWLLWNYYHRAPVTMQSWNTGNTYAYTTAAWQAAFGVPKLSQARFVRGVNDRPMFAEANMWAGAAGGVAASHGFGLDDPETNSAQLIGIPTYSGGDMSQTLYEGRPSAGLHTLYWLNYGNGADSVFLSTGGVAHIQMGLRVRGDF